MPYSDPRRSFTAQWPNIRPNVTRLLEQRNIPKPDWQHLFETVHYVQSWDEEAKNLLPMALRREVVEHVREAQKRIDANQEDNCLLAAYIKEWKKFFEQCVYFPLPFRSSNGPHKAGASVWNRDDENVRTMLLNTWNNDVFMAIKHRLIGSALKLIQAERKGDFIESQLVIGVRESCVHLRSGETKSLEVYTQYFEAPYLDAAAEYFKVEGANQLEKLGVLEYMAYAEAKMTEEEARGARYFEKNAESSVLLREALIENLIERYMDQMLAECTPLIKRNDIERLSLLYKLMDKIPDEQGIAPMLEQVEAHIRQQGLADMEANASIITQDCEKYVEALLELYTQFSELVENATKNDPRFLATRDKGFEAIVNDISIFKIEIPNKPRSSKTTPESRCPELLATYSDMLLRKTMTSKKLTSEQIDAKLRDVVTVLRYVKNKDVFMRYHKSHLTRRLVLELSIDNEKEENMLENLRNAGMPADYINNMEVMFRDIDLSRTLTAEFKKAKQAQGKTSFLDTVNFKVLNTGSWARGSDTIPITLPVELEDFIPEVEEFYESKYNGRKLQWHHHLANGTLNFKNEVGNFELEVTTLQMAVLFAWNRRPEDKISFEMLRLATELPDPELRKTLYSLVNLPRLKRQVLMCDLPELKSPKDFKENSLFWINQKFCVVKNNKDQTRGRVSLIGRLQLASEKAPEETNLEIAYLRELRTEEGIVRILKARKEMSFAQLQTELVEILKEHFAPSKKLIKEVIEKLIESNIVKRSEEKINEYVYAG